MCLVKLDMCQKHALFSPSVFDFWGVAYSCLFGFGRFSVRWGPKGPTSPKCVSCLCSSFVLFCCHFC